MKKSGRIVSKHQIRNSKQSQNSNGKKYKIYTLLVIGIWSLVIFLSPAFAQDKDLSINAHNLAYSEDGSSVEASGSVEVTYNDLKVTGEKLVYYAKEKKIYTDSGFNMQYQGLDFSGQTLSFELKNKVGHAKNIILNYNNVILTGQDVFIDNGKISLKVATFTTCSLKDPHYHFMSKDIFLNTDEGWLVCYWSSFWLDGITAMLMPVYVYDVSSQLRGATQQTMPIPQFGSDTYYGPYVYETLPWFLSSKLNGDGTVGYANKKGILLGMNLRYKNNDENSGFLKFNYNPKDPIVAVYQHNFDFGSSIKNSEVFNFSLIKIPEFKQFELSTKLGINELINYEKVTNLPLLTLSLKQGMLGSFKFDGNVGAGFITEESSGFGSSRVSGILNASIPIPNDKIGIITPYINNDLRFYGNSTHWIQSWGGINLNKIWSEKVTTSVGFKHFMLQKGTSPYNFELYRYVPFDQVYAGFILSNGTSKLGVNALYNLPALNPQDFDYLLKIGIHCFDISVSYRAMRSELLFGFDLI